MKRNWDIIREILLKVEECTLPADMVRLSNFPSERAPEISYHAALLIEAGLIKGDVSRTIGPEVKDFIAYRLTWEGHEFLDAVRSDTVWEKTKQVFAKKGIEMTFDLVKSGAGQLAGALLRTALGS